MPTYMFRLNNPGRYAQLRGGEMFRFARPSALPGHVALSHDRVLWFQASVADVAGVRIEAGEEAPLVGVGHLLDARLQAASPSIASHR